MAWLLYSPHQLQPRAQALPRQHNSTTVHSNTHTHKPVSHIPSGNMQCRATSTVLPLDSSFTSQLSSLLHVSTTALCHKQSSHFTSTRTPGRTAEKSNSLCKHNSTIQCWQPNVICKFEPFYRILRHYTTGLEVAHGPNKAAAFTFKGHGLLQPWWWRHHKSLKLQEPLNQWYAVSHSARPESS